MVKRGCCSSTLEVGLFLCEPNRSGGIVKKTFAVRRVTAAFLFIKW